MILMIVSGILLQISFELGNVKLISLSLESDSRKSWEAYQIRESVNLISACFIQKKVEKLKISLAKKRMAMFVPCGCG